MSVFRSARLDLESLAERLVPSATVLDLTTQDATGTAASGAIVEQVDAQPTGTGHIRSFVRLQGASSGGGSQQGFNTDGRPLVFDENKSPQFTRSITLGQVPVVFRDGVAYREFLLDINQKASSPYLSLDEVRVYLGSTGNSTSLAALTHVFDLDAGGDVSVKLKATLNSGSGSGDMALLIPVSAFAGADPNSFLYLYSKMGGLSTATANGGFEEWAVRSTPPQSATGNGSLSGFVYFDANQDATDGFNRGIAGVTIQLQGVNDLGETVVLTTTTDENGAYTFTGLRAGTYSIWEEQPAGYADGNDYLGTINGEVVGTADENDRFAEIQLLTDEDGIDYIFTEFIQE
jgi:hypothetical protein